MSVTSASGYFRTHEGLQIPLVNAENMLNEWVFYAISFSNIEKKVIYAYIY